MKASWSLIILTALAYGSNKKPDPAELEKALAAGLASRAVITSTPPGATVFIDGTRLDVKTPVSVIVLKKSPAMKVLIELDGYLEKDRYVAFDGPMMNVDFSLERSPVRLDPAAKDEVPHDARFDRRGLITLVSGTMHENAPYTVTAGDRSYGCYADDHSVDCQEQTTYAYKTVRLVDFHGKSGNFSYVQNSYQCDPLGDMVSRVAKSFDYRYGKGSREIIVPCSYLDRRNKVKTGEARYDVFESVL
jgi:hypothetical protein